MVNKILKSFWGIYNWNSVLSVGESIYMDEETWDMEDDLVPSSSTEARTRRALIPSSSTIKPINPADFEAIIPKDYNIHKPPPTNGKV